MSSPDEEPRVNAWLGPPGQISPLHTDPYDNMLCQVHGLKYVTLFSPEDDELLCPFDSINQANTSQIIDPRGAEAERRWPTLAQAKPLSAILEPGDVLYMPKKWWHFVLADPQTDFSASVNFWWLSQPLDSA